MSQVTIKATNTHLFERDAIVTVERTSFIERLIELEQVIVVDPSQAPAPTESQAVAVNPVLVVPARNDQTSVWAAFLANAVVATPDLFPGVELTGDESRTTLIALWDAAHPELNDVDTTGMPAEVPSNADGATDADLVEQTPPPHDPPADTPPPADTSDYTDPPSDPTD